MRRAAAWILLLAVSSCGGGATPPTSASTITITSSGVNPAQLSVAQGSRVLFVNDDARPHNMTSDPHPDHQDCPELNSVGLLQPGERRESGNLNTVRSCGFHDHDDPPPGGSRWAGRITIR